MMRIGLFLLTNMAILMLASITLNLLGFNSIMAANGVDLNLNALLVDLLRLKPASSKGQYLLKISLSTTMGLGVIVDPSTLQTR